MTGPALPQDKPRSAITDHLAMQKFVAYIGNALGVLGMVLVVGSIATWLVGLEWLSWLYERTKPILPFFLAGVGLIVLACLLSPTWRNHNAVTSPRGPLPSQGSGDIRCAKCEALNDGQARFCDQCGAGLGGQQPSLGIRDAQGVRAGPGALADRPHD